MSGYFLHAYQWQRTAEASWARTVAAAAPLHAFVKYQDCRQIQDHVEDRRKNKEIQRCAAVPHGPQDPCDHIVVDGGSQTAENNADIAGGVLENILRRIHEPKKGICPDHT